MKDLKLLVYIHIISELQMNTAYASEDGRECGLGP